MSLYPPITNNINIRPNTSMAKIGLFSVEALLLVAVRKDNNK